MAISNLITDLQSARGRKSMDEVYVGQILKFHISLSAVALPNWMGSWEKRESNCGLEEGEDGFCWATSSFCYTLSLLIHIYYDPVLLVFTYYIQGAMTQRI